MIDESPRRWNIVRDTAAGALLCGAGLLPWNLYFGFGIAGSDPRLFAAVGLATLLSLASLAAGRFRAVLNGPYLILVSGFVIFDVVQTIRYGGTAQPPGGVGPGAWLGVAGALLAARPALNSARALGYASALGAGLSVAFNLYWRIRYAVADSGAATDLGRQHGAIIVTALMYGAVAWAAVFVASRWISNGDKPARLAALVLGGSALTAGVLVWALPVGRTIDGFHGIAQNTSTAGVGFEGYLLWAAAAAIFVDLRAGNGVRLAAARKILLLIVVWCGGSALLRGTDLAVAVSLGLAHSLYHSAAMAAFDVVTAVLAAWLRINLANRSVPAAAIWPTCAILVGFTIARIVVGVGLAPHLAEAQRRAAIVGPVYGNGLAQQITSTFDVVLCGLALYTLATAIIAARTRHSAAAPENRPVPRIFRSEAPTRQLPGGTPRIFRGAAQGSSNGS